MPITLFSFGFLDSETKNECIGIVMVQVDCLTCLFSHPFFLLQYCEYFGSVWYLVANAEYACPGVGFYLHFAYITLPPVLLEQNIDSEKAGLLHS